MPKIIFVPNDYFMSDKWTGVVLNDGAAFLIGVNSGRSSQRPVSLLKEVPENSHPLSQEQKKQLPFDVGFALMCVAESHGLTPVITTVV